MKLSEANSVSGIMARPPRRISTITKNPSASTAATASASDVGLQPPGPEPRVKAQVRAPRPKVAQTPPARSRGCPRP